MSCGFYIPPFLDDSSCVIQEKSRTYHTDIDLAVVFLLSDDSELFMEFSGFIRYELDTERVLIAKLLMRRF